MMMPWKKKKLIRKLAEAYGKEPDWKRRKRAEQSRNVRSQQKREDKWLKEQERIAAEKRRAYMERVKRK